MCINNQQYSANPEVRMHAGSMPGRSLARQRGFVLVLSLVMLTVLTLIGVSSMNTANIELKATANAQQHQIAFNAAQALLEYSVSMPVVSTGEINYRQNDPNAADQEIIKAAADLNLTDIQTLNATARFVGCTIAPNSSLEAGKGFAYSYFVIDGMATNKTGTASSLQSQAVRFPAAGCT